MEVYAAYLTYTDHEIKRLVDALTNLGQLENTVIFVMIGDNGASKEGNLFGNIDRTAFNAVKSEQEEIDFGIRNMDKIGRAEGISVNYPIGWAQTCNTPFMYWKSDAHSEGGTRNPMILFNPRNVTDKGGIRRPFGYSPNYIG